MTTEAAPVTTKSSPPREYIILQKSSGEYWAKAGKVTAVSVDQAIKKHIAAVDLAEPNLAQDGEDDQFLAVPARYWKPVTAKIEVKSTVTLS